MFTRGWFKSAAVDLEGKRGAIPELYPFELITGLKG
jgi:hypothetical protein